MIKSTMMVSRVFAKKDNGKFQGWASFLLRRMLTKSPPKTPKPKTTSRLVQLPKGSWPALSCHIFDCASGKMPTHRSRETAVADRAGPAGLVCWTSGDQMGMYMDLRAT